MINEWSPDPANSLSTLIINFYLICVRAQTCMLFLVDYKYVSNGFAPIFLDLFASMVNMYVGISVSLHFGVDVELYMYVTSVVSLLECWGWCPLSVCLWRILGHNSHQFANGFSQVFCKVIIKFFKLFHEQSNHLLRKKNTDRKFFNVQSLRRVCLSLIKTYGSIYQEVSVDWKM